MRPLGRRLVGFGFGFCFGFGQNRSRSRRGGKVGISRLWRDSQGSVGAGGNLLLVFAGFHAPAFSTALRRSGRPEIFPVAIVPSHHMRPEPDRNRLIQVLMERLASSILVIPAKRNSCGKRPCQVPKLRSDRPRAWGE